MTVIGIDPGKSGSLAIIDDHIKVIPFDEQNYLDALRSCDKKFAICYVEQVHAMPHDGGKGAFSFGRNLGLIEGWLQALQIPYQTVPPQVWKKEFSLIGKDKQASIDTCKHLYPSVTLKPTERCKKDNDGMAEAVLIATYGRRKEIGGK